MHCCKPGNHFTSSLKGASNKVLIPPQVPWFLAVYVRDVMTQLDEVKVTRKLGGKAAGPASCTTDLGNEYSKVLMSVLTDSEGEGLMAIWCLV